MNTSLAKMYLLQSIWNFKQLSPNICYEGNINNQNSEKFTDTFQKCQRSAFLWNIPMVKNIH